MIRIVLFLIFCINQLNSQTIDTTAITKKQSSFKNEKQELEQLQKNIQNSKKNNGPFLSQNQLLLSIGYNYFKWHSLEFMLKIANEEASKTSLSKSGGNDYFVAYKYYQLGSEFAFYNDEFQVAPKIGIGGNLIIVDGSLNLIAYNQGFKNFNFALVPEVGISILGSLNLNYGMNLFLSENNETKRYPLSRFNLQWNILLKE